MRSKYGFSMDYASLSPVKTEDDASQNAPTPSRPMLTAFRILIRLGDLARYQRDAIGLTDTDWSASWSYYMDAQRVMPEQGMPYNQLAVLCTYAHDTIGALFYYSQSLALPVPSETGKANIEVLMRDASLANYVEAKRKYSESSVAVRRARGLGDGLEAGTSLGSSQASNIGDLWIVFAQGFLALHNASDAKALDDAAKERDNILADFATLVSQDWIINNPPSAVPGPPGPHSSTFLHLMLYNIFGCWSVEKNAESNPIAARRLQLLLQFSYAMLSIIIERAVADLQVISASQDASVAESSAAGCLTLLPAIATFLEWAATHGPSTTFDLDVDSEDILFSRLQASFANLLSAVLPVVRNAIHLPKWQIEKFEPLPEDLLLHPSLPLATAHESVDFSSKCHSGSSHNALLRRCFKIYQFAKYLYLTPSHLCGAHGLSVSKESQQTDITYIYALSPNHLEEIEAIENVPAADAAPEASPAAMYAQEPSIGAPSSPGFHSQSSVPMSPHHQSVHSLSSATSSDSALGLLADQVALYGTSSASAQSASMPHSFFPRNSPTSSPQAIGRPRNIFGEPGATEEDLASHPLPDAQPSSGGYDLWGAQDNHAAMAVDPSPQEPLSLPVASIMTSGTGHFNPFLLPNTVTSPQPSQLGLMAQGTQSIARDGFTPFAFPSSTSNAPTTHSTTHPTS